MDPITRASRAFLAEADAFWRAGRGHVLPMIAAPSARGDLIKTLRLAELAIENRRPLFLHEAPFSAARAWGDDLAASIALDYQAVREGAAKEGVALPPFPAAGEGPNEKDPPLAHAVWAMERAAALLADRLDGVLVAILPAKVEDARAYRDAVATLAATRFSPRVRVAVHHPPGGPLEGVLGEGARFHVDPDELAEHLKQLGGGGSEGPPGPAPPAPTEEQRLAYEAKTGRKLPSPEDGKALRALLLDAATATGRRDHVAAATHYRAARDLCQRAGLALEEAMVLLALGGACLAAGTVELAEHAYRQAAEIAARMEAWAVACQAWLGAGGAELTVKRYEAAAAAYGAAADMAASADLVVLRVEALRMAGTCHVLRGAQPEAMRAWLQAVDAGGEIPVAERPASTFPQVAEDLAAMLERRGLAAQAAHVRSLVTAEPSPPLAEPQSSGEPSIQTLDIPARAAQRSAPVLPFVPAHDVRSPLAEPPLAPPSPFTGQFREAPVVQAPIDCGAVHMPDLVADAASPSGALTDTVRLDPSAIIAAAERGPLPFAPSTPGAGSAARRGETDFAAMPLETYANVTAALAQGERREDALARYRLSMELFERLATAWARRFQQEPQLLARFRELVGAHVGLPLPIAEPTGGSAVATAVLDPSAIIAAIQRGQLPFVPADPTKAAASAEEPDEARHTVELPPAVPSLGGAAACAILPFSRSESTGTVAADDVDLAQLPLETYASLSAALARGEPRADVLAKHGLSADDFDRLAKAWAQRFRQEPHLLARFKDLATRRAHGRSQG